MAGVKTESKRKYRTREQSMRRISFYMIDDIGGISIGLSVSASTLDVDDDFLSGQVENLRNVLMIMIKTGTNNWHSAMARWVHI